jgi:hypothetical protein
MFTRRAPVTRRKPMPNVTPSKDISNGVTFRIGFAWIRAPGVYGETHPHICWVMPSCPMLQSKGEPSESASGRLANGILGFRARTASVKFLIGVPEEAANAFGGDRLIDLVQRILLGGEAVFPYGGRASRNDDLQNPSPVVLAPIDQDFNGDPFPSESAAQRRSDDLEFVVHSATRTRANNGHAHNMARCTLDKPVS